jgi:repressor LexA
VAGAEEIIDPGAVLPWLPGDFFLRVRGESMTGDGIMDGDLVLLRPNTGVPNGAIAAACVGDEREATLKRVFFEGNNVRLRAANPAWPDVVVPGESLWVAGIFKGLVRHAGPPS